MPTRQLTDALSTARTLTEQGAVPTLSVFFDLDPEQFATPPARATQARSLVDEARRLVDAHAGLARDERATLRKRVEELEGLLGSDELPVSEGRAIALYATPDRGWLTLPLEAATASAATLDRGPVISPVLAGAPPERWSVVLVSRRDGRIFLGSGSTMEEAESVEDDVHGQHQQGGWSQARYERSVEEEIDRHLRALADTLHARWRRRPFERVVLGGPSEIVPRLADVLHEDLRRRLHETHLELDVGTATADDVTTALAPLLELADNERLQRTLARLREALATGGRASAGTEATLAALNERRVETLLLDRNFSASGARCPTCGLLQAGAPGTCPADGAQMTGSSELREAAIAAALAQDADVLLLRERPDLAPHEGIAAVNRF